MTSVGGGWACWSQLDRAPVYPATAPCGRHTSDFCADEVGCGFKKLCMDRKSGLCQNVLHESGLVIGAVLLEAAAPIESFHVWAGVGFTAGHLLIQGELNLSHSDISLMKCHCV